MYPGKNNCPKGGSMQRKVAYVFLYKNGIRERSVGIVRRYGTAEQPEVALELFADELRRKRWKIYYFTKGGALVEATYLWGGTRERGTSEARIVQCRLCVEAGAGEGIVLLSAEENWTEKETEQKKTTNEREFREYLCARYDGKEVTAEDLRKAFRRKTEREVTENPCVESAKRLMEEIAKAAGGEISAGEEEVGTKTAGAEATREQTVSVLEKEQVTALHRKRKSSSVKQLEKLMQTNPPYVPCRNGNVEYSVRITPEDLRCLSEERKGYVENSYLLHGYYRYRHVLLGRRIRKEKEEYVLMVPGIYGGREAGLATMFGFPEFLPVNKTKPETGGAASGKALFGYFCGKI